METSWKIKLTGEITSQLLLTKSNQISAQISKACLMNGQNIIKIPTSLLDIVDTSIFDDKYDVIFENEIDRIFIYRNDIFELKHFIQRKEGEIIGAGVKFSDKLFDGEEFINNERMCGEIILN
jgi:hypothetical protein